MSFNARIKSKRDTASNWETNNPVLLNGELIIVDTNAGDVRFKIGDGVKTYTQLPFQDESLYNVLSTKADSADLESIQASIVQSDLSQTDNTAKDYVKGVIRQESLPEGYPYRETVGTILDGTFEFAADSDGIYRYQITDENFAIVDNESYVVIWDGKTYRCAAAIFSGVAIILGNLAIANAGADTGEPFLFVHQGADKLINTTDTAATHTVTVCAENIHQIAEEFIPDIGRGMILKNFNGAMPAPMNWSSIAYGNGKFVTVAMLYSKAAYCDDDLNWKYATLPSAAWWFSIAYGNGKFVIVSYDNSTASAYSEDGITWTASTLPSSADWRSVTYGNGKFVAVAQNSTTAAYSEDGITWTAATLPSSQRWSSVTYGNGKFVVVSQDSTVAAYSTDGISWTAATLPSSVTWFSVTYGNGKFVAVAYNSDTAAYSADGITWTAATMPSRANWSSITYGNGKFVTIADNSTTAAYSEDGITWIQTTLPSSEHWQSVAYGNGKFVAVVNASTTVAYSRDGIHWKTELTLISQNGKDVTSDTLNALNHTPDLSQADPTQIDYVKGVIRQESLPEGYPYVTKKVIEWDGNTTGKVAVSNTFYKVSDEIPSNDELKENGILYATNNANQTMSGTNISQIWNTYISYGTITNDYAFLEYIAVIRNANTEISVATFPEPGVYFLKSNDSTWTTKLDYSKVSKLDDKYFDSAYVIDVKVGQADNGGETFTLTSGNFSDAYSAYLNKKIIIMQMNGYSGNTLVCVGADTSDQLKFADLTKCLNYFMIRILQFASDNTISVYQENNLAYYDHTQSASKISAGTFAGQVVANASGQTSGTMLLRNSKLVSAEETPTVNGEICWVYS